MFVFALNLSSHILLRYYDKAIKNIIMIHFINCLKLFGKPNNSYLEICCIAHYVDCKQFNLRDICKFDTPTSFFISAFFP